MYNRSNDIDGIAGLNSDMQVYELATQAWGPVAVNVSFDVPVTDGDNLVPIRAFQAWKCHGDVFPNASFEQGCQPFSDVTNLKPETPEALYALFPAPKPADYIIGDPVYANELCMPTADSSKWWIIRDDSPTTHDSLNYTKEFNLAANSDILYIAPSGEDMCDQVVTKVTKPVEEEPSKCQFIKEIVDGTDENGTYREVIFADGCSFKIYDGKDGADGAPGAPGRDGADGKDGVDGTNGKDGKDGKSISVERTYVDDNGNTVVVFDNGDEIVIKPGQSPTNIYIIEKTVQGDGSTIIKFSDGSEVVIPADNSGAGSNGATSSFDDNAFNSSNTVNGSAGAGAGSSLEQCIANPAVAAALIAIPAFVIGPKIAQQLNIPIVGEIQQQIRKVQGDLGIQNDELNRLAAKFRINPEAATAIGATAAGMAVIALLLTPSVCGDKSIAASASSA